MNGITKETFKDADTDTKLLLLFDCLGHIYKLQKDHPEACKTKFEKINKRFETLEKKKLKDTATSSLFGFIGGFLAVLGKKFFGM